MFQRLIKSIKVARLWSKALDEASAGSYSDALTELHAAYSIFETEIGSLKAPYNLNILAGHLLCGLGRHQDAIDVLSSAKKQVNFEKSLSLSEREYLIYYCNLDICHSASVLSDEGTLTACKLEKKFNFAELNKVRVRFKKYFPIRIEAG